jgi:hypothetical protein
MSLSRERSPRGERARHAAEETESATEADQIVRWSGSIRVGEIIQALERKAREGDAHASRELRSWLADYPPHDEEISLEELGPVRRQKLLKRLIAEIEEEERKSVPAETKGAKPSRKRVVSEW